MKTKTTYICSECGYKSPKWLGKCPGCNSWNTIQETVITEKKTSATRAVHEGGNSVWATYPDDTECQTNVISQGLCRSDRLNHTVFDHCPVFS